MMIETTLTIRGIEVAIAAEGAVYRADKAYGGRYDCDEVTVTRPDGRPLPARVRKAITPRQMSALCDEVADAFTTW